VDVADNVDADSDAPVYGDRSAFFEPIASDRSIGIKIRNLTKVFIISLLA